MERTNCIDLFILIQSEIVLPVFSLSQISKSGRVNVEDEMKSIRIVVRQEKFTIDQLEDSLVLQRILTKEFFSYCF